MASKKKPVWVSQATKYELGDNACGNCQRFRHSKCRPRLDGTLCSCSCGSAQSIRELHEDVVAAEIELHGHTPEVRETLSSFFPRILRF